MKDPLLPLILLVGSLLALVFPFYRELNSVPSPLVKRSGNEGRRTYPTPEAGNFSLEDLPQLRKEPAAAAEPAVFHNPAGCSPGTPADLSPGALLAEVQAEVKDQMDLQQRRIDYVWNGLRGSFVDISDNPYVYEFEVNEFQPPFTYRADQIVASFVQNGFAVWLRAYGGTFRLLAVSLLPGPHWESWGEYITAYWQPDGRPGDDFILPVSRKLPCQWMVAEGYVSRQALAEILDLEWGVPDYLEAGRHYLAGSCSEAYRVSQEMVGYWDASSMCGPLTWQIIHDANGFPFRIGSYDANSDLFIAANPHYWGQRPWSGFDPETFDLFQVGDPLAGYDFAAIGELNPGDMVFSYGSSDQWAVGDGSFSHIFLVAGLDEFNSRLAVTNLVQNRRGAEDCSISEVILYRPDAPEVGIINQGWNDQGYGLTGRCGFDVFRWKWISYHLEGEARAYSVRRGETLETIAFDWKVSPQSIQEANRFPIQVQLEPGQVIILPPPEQ